MEEQNSEEVQNEEDIIHSLIHDIYKENDVLTKDIFYSIFIAYAFLLPEYFQNNTFVEGMGLMMIGFSIYYTTKMIMNFNKVEKLRKFREL